MQYSTIKIETVRANPDFRYEAEFFSPKYLHNDRQLKNCATISLTEIATFHNGAAYDSNELNSQGDLWVAKIGDITNKRDYILWDKVSLSHFAKLKAGYLKHKDILMTLTGDPPDVGKVNLVFSPPTKKLTWNQRVARIRLKNNDRVFESFYLFAALSSKYCRDHIERWAKGIRQRNVGNPAVLSMPVPVFSLSLQKDIAHAVDYSFLLLQQSGKNFTHAQTLLLSELGFLDWEPNHALSFVSNYSETEKAERFDAEYFQPKYEKIVKAIKKYKGGWDTLGNLVTVKKCVEVGSGEYLDDGIPFVRVSNLSPFEITEEKYISEKLYTEIKQHQPKKGEILFSKDATPGIAYYLQEQPQKMIPSGGILRLKSKKDKINNEYLTLVLNSILTKEQVNRDVGGSVILHWRPDQVKEMVIPILPEEKQIQIKQKITESFNLRKQSKYLLEYAKKAVEMAIEKNEKTAVNWMKQQAEKLKI